MRPVIVLSVIIRMCAVLMLASAIGLRSVHVFGYVNPGFHALSLRGEALAWYLAGSLIAAGVLWIYASQVSSWLIGSFNRPLAVGLRAAALVTAALNTGSFTVSIYRVLNLSELSSEFLFQLKPAPGSIIGFYLLSIMIIFVAPKLDDFITNREKLKQLRSETESERT